ncbi:MAG: Flp pilus assembly protein CpaB [Isosphaeraceae bacterium]
MLLILAVACGLGAMYGVSKLTASRKTSNELVNVLVAAREIKMEEVLKEDMVKTVPFPRSHVPAGAVLSYKEIEGRWVKITMLANDPIVEAKLAPEGAPIGLTPRIPKGMRAVAIEVTEKTGVSGFILPDHRVDVIQTKGVQSDPGGGSQSETILEDVQVLAVGTSITRPDDKAVQARTVTLALKPEDAGIVVAAGDKGPLSLSLRGLDDHAPVRTAKPKAKEATLPVLVATRDLKPDEPIQSAMVKVKNVRASEAPPGVAKSEGEVVGKTLQIPIFEGESIHLAKLVGEAPLELETGPRPKPGMRAVTIEVDSASGSVAKIKTNEYVDVILTSKSEATNAVAGPQAVPVPAQASIKSRVVLQDALVLKPPSQGAGELSQAGPQWTLTLEVHPRDLTTLTEAQASGTLTVALRDPGDHQRYTPPMHIPAQIVERKGVVYSGLLAPHTYMIERRKVSEAIDLGERFEDPSEPEAVTVNRGR